MEISPRDLELQDAIQATAVVNIEQSDEAIAYTHNTGETASAESLEAVIRSGVCPYLGKIAAEQSPEQALRMAQIAERGQAKRLTQPDIATAVEKPVLSIRKQTIKQPVIMKPPLTELAATSAEQLPTPLQIPEAVLKTTPANENYEDPIARAHTFEQEVPSNETIPYDHKVTPQKAEILQSAPAPTAPITLQEKQPKQVVKTALPTRLEQPFTPELSDTGPISEQPPQLQPESDTSLPLISDTELLFTAEPMTAVELADTQPMQPQNQLGTDTMKPQEKIEAEPAVELSPAQHALVEELLHYPEQALDSLEPDTTVSIERATVQIEDFTEKLQQLVFEPETAADEAEIITELAITEQSVEQITALLRKVDMIIEPATIRTFIETEGPTSLYDALLAAYQMRDHAFQMEYVPTMQSLAMPVPLNHRFARLLVSLLSRPALNAA